MTARRLSDGPIVASEGWYAPNIIDATKTEARQEWSELLTLHARGVPIEYDRFRLALGHGPIPTEMRAKVWLTFSGAEKRMVQHPEAYDQLCQRVTAFHEAVASSSNQPHGQVAQSARRVLEQIEKDLGRTQADSGDERLSAMRRVLCAFASFQPEIGYVQGMNFIVFALLTVFDEPSAFWMLACIVTDWLPEHFSATMVGNHIDCRVLSTLTANHLPRLATRLHELDITAQLLTTRWFLCLWSSVLTEASLHRLWDFLFVSGPGSTMQAALACMYLIEQPVLASTDIGEALGAVKDVLRECVRRVELVGLKMCGIACIWPHGTVAKPLKDMSGGSHAADLAHPLYGLSHRPCVST